MPGEASPAASFAPRVYIPLQDLAQTNLLKPGSLARYLNFVKFAPGLDVAAEVEKLAPQIEKAGLEYDTVAKRKKDLGRSLDNLYRFLNLVGFHFAPPRRGRGGERDPGASPAKGADRGHPALPRRGRTHDRRRLSSAGDGDGPGRGPHRSGAWPNDAPDFSRTAAELYPVCPPESDRLDAGLGRDGGRSGGLHPLCASAAPAFSPRFAAPHSARLGG